MQLLSRIILSNTVSSVPYLVQHRILWLSGHRFTSTSKGNCSTCRYCRQFWFLPLFQYARTTNGDDFKWNWFLKYIVMKCGNPDMSDLRWPCIETAWARANKLRLIILIELIRGTWMPVATSKSLRLVQISLSDQLFDQMVFKHNAKRVCRDLAANESFTCTAIVIVFLAARFLVKCEHLCANRVLKNDAESLVRHWLVERFWGVGDKVN